MTVAQAEKYVERLLQDKPRPRRQVILKDVRLFCNTLERHVQTLRQSGLAAECFRRQDGDDLLFTVRIPGGGAVRPS